MRCKVIEKKDKRKIKNFRESLSAVAEAGRRSASFSMFSLSAVTTDAVGEAARPSYIVRELPYGPHHPLRGCRHRQQD